MKTLFILITTCFTGIFNYAGIETIDNLQNCRSELTVEKDRTFKSADEEGAVFSLVLENKSASSITYQLSAKNLSTSCKNKTAEAQGSKNSNVSLDVSFQTNDTYMTESNTVIIGSGESLKFKVYVSVPNGTPFNRWGCVEVEAASQECGPDSLKTILSVYVPNPSEG